MGRNKLARFEANTNNDLVIEEGKEWFTTIKGKWRSHFFKNNHPIVLELGCGRGEYTVGLAQSDSSKNYIGVDIKGSRLCFGANTAKELAMPNVAFLRTMILYLHEFFEPEEVDEIWVTFPDPRPKSKDERKRLISPRFLTIYKNALKKGGVVHLKTDDIGLYEYSVELVQQLGLTVLASTNDLYSSSFLQEHKGIQTTYEKKFLAEGKKITYLKFIL